MITGCLARFVEPVRTVRLQPTVKHVRVASVSTNNKPAVLKLTSATLKRVSDVGQIHFRILP